MLLEWLRKEQNSIFPFIQRTFLGLCSFHVSGRQRYFITVHFPKWLKCPGTHTCGMSHQKCNLALELSSKPATLVIKAKPSYLRPWMSPTSGSSRIGIQIESEKTKIDVWAKKKWLGIHSWKQGRREAMWYYRKRTSCRVRHYGRFFATLASTIWMTVVKTLPLPCIRLFCDMRVPGSTSKVTLLIIFCYTCCPVSWRNGKGREWGRRRESIGRQVELQNKQTVTRETSWMDGTRKNTWKRQARKTIQRRKYFGIKEVDWQLNKMLNLQPLRKPNAGKKKRE